jgi:hypothetical protein
MCVMCDDPKCFFIHFDCPACRASNKIDMRSPTLSKGDLIKLFKRGFR